jgi:hypothetical protein
MQKTGIRAPGARRTGLSGGKFDHRRSVLPVIYWRAILGCVGNGAIWADTD